MIVLKTDYYDSGSKRNNNVMQVRNISEKSYNAISGYITEKDFFSEFTQL